MQDVRPFDGPKRSWLDKQVRPPGLSLNATGLVVGTTFVLASFSKERSIEIDPDRVLALLSVGHRRPIDVDVLGHIQAACAHWKDGDKALANFRLLFARLPPLDQPGDTQRLCLANG